MSYRRYPVHTRSPLKRVGLALALLVAGIWDLLPILFVLLLLISR